jgi:4a-hydroxytetrahydrobiopterin dehydratase
MLLAEQRCETIRAGTPPLTPAESRELAREVADWTLGPDALEREFKFADFRAAIAFVNRVAEIADREDHHPDIAIAYNKVRLVLSTHRIGGLSRNDFIVAARIDACESGTGV